MEMSMSSPKQRKTSQTRINKAKGRKAQQAVAKIIAEYFMKEQYELEYDDVVSRPMGSPGTDLILSPKAQKILPFDVEVKSGKSFNLVRAVQQAENKGRTGRPGLAIGRYDYEKDWYACVNLKVLLELIDYAYLCNIEYCTHKDSLFSKAKGGK